MAIGCRVVELTARLKSVCGVSVSYPTLATNAPQAGPPRKAGFWVDRWTGFPLLGCGTLAQALAGQMARATKKKDGIANHLNDWDGRGKPTTTGEHITRSTDRNAEIAA
jgi:hypothetical protein